MRSGHRDRCWKMAFNSADEVTAMTTASAALAGQDLVIVGGSVPDPVANGLYAEICTSCHELAIPIWVDSYGEAMDETLQGAHPPHLAKPNREELASSQAWQRVSELHITDGPQRTERHAPEGNFELRPPQVEEVNPIGCGDCYLAGLAHGVLSGWEPSQRYAYAAACGAAKAQRWDVAMIDPGSDIDRLADQARVTPLA